MRPSFFALFKRGKYFHTAQPPVRGNGKLLRVRGNTREAERFAAAALGFAWQHDQQLRKRIWETLCQFRGDPPLSRRATIHIEPEDWADLLVINRVKDRRFAYVIECKIAAPLEKQQDPSLRRFARAGGYGRFFVDSEVGTDLRYVVLRLQSDLDLSNRPRTLPIRVQQRAWDAVASTFPDTPFARDLALSLGKLGVTAFPASETRNMRVDTKRSELGNAIRTLADIQIYRLKWPSGRGSSADFYQEDTRWFLGVELKYTSKSERLQFARETRKTSCTSASLDGI